MAAGVLSMMYGDLTKNAHVAKIGVSMMIGGMCVSTVGLAL